MNEPVVRYSLTRDKIYKLEFALRQYMKQCSMRGYSYPEFIEVFQMKLLSDNHKMRKVEESLTPKDGDGS